jgi:hypothetical protein
MIFLSDGECSLEDEVIQDVCRSAVGLGWVTFDLSARVQYLSSFGLESRFLSMRFPSGASIILIRSSGWHNSL